MHYRKDTASVETAYIKKQVKLLRKSGRAVIEMTALVFLLFFSYIFFPNVPIINYFYKSPEILTLVWGIMWIQYYATIRKTCANILEHLEERSEKADEASKDES